MALQTLSQGNTIVVKFKPVEAVDHETPVIAYLFTNVNKPLKFSIPHKDGYNDITLTDGEYRFIAEGQQTKNFCGELFLSIYFNLDTTENDRRNKTRSTGIEITRSPIAVEVV